MTTELHVNGRIELALTPSDDIEAAIMNRMIGAAEKGQTITLTSAGDGMGTIVVSVAR